MRVPLLVTVGGLDHAQHDELRLGAAGTLGRPIDGAVAFLGVIDDNQVFALVTFLVALALAAHRRSRSLTDAQALNGGMAAAPATSGLLADIKEL
jgi:hypothetical protein